jgi:hypothetical protein
MSVVIVPQDVIDFASALSSTPDSVWLRVLAYVNSYDLGQVADEEDVALARIYLAAHMVAYNKRAATGAAGPVTGESAGNVRRSYGLIASTSSTALNSTGYGQAFLDILRRSPANGPMVV